MRLAPPWLPASLVSLLSAALAVGMLRAGITVGPDGWAYWEGSVSMLHGLGYRYFGGQGIESFPPGYSAALAVAQWLGGVSGATLIGVTVLLAAAAAWLWSFLVFDAIGANRVTAWFAALFAAAYIASAFTAVEADTLSLSLTALVTIFLVRMVRATTPHEAVAAGWLACAALAMALGIKNASIALLPGALAAVACIVPRHGIRAAALVIAGLLAALGAWLALRHAFGQLGSHPLASPGANASPRARAIEALTDLAMRFGPLRASAGMALLGATVSVIGVNLPRARGRAAAAGWVCAAMAVSTLVSLLAIFSVVRIDSPLAGRFLMPVVLPLVVAAAASAPTAGWPLGATAVILALVCSIQWVRTGEHVFRRASGAVKANVQAAHTLSPDYVSGPPTEWAGKILIAPETFPWIHRTQRQ